MAEWRRRTSARRVQVGRTSSRSVTVPAFAAYPLPARPPRPRTLGKQFRLKPCPTSRNELHSMGVYTYAVHRDVYAMVEEGN